MDRCRVEVERGDVDRSTLAAVAAGNATGLRVLAARHGSALLTYLTSLAGNPSTAEEILQDTLVAAWQGAAGFGGRSSVRTWLFAIARRRAAATLGRRRLSVVDDAETALATIADAAPGPEEHALARADLEQVSTAMRTLSPLHRELLLLACVEEMTGPEISVVLGVPLGTVKSRLAHARRALIGALAADDAKVGVRHGCS